MGVRGGAMFFLTEDQIIAELLYFIILFALLLWVYRIDYVWFLKGNHKTILHTLLYYSACIIVVNLQDRLWL